MPNIEPIPLAIREIVDTVVSQGVVTIITHTGPKPNNDSDSIKWIIEPTPAIKDGQEVPDVFCGKVIFNEMLSGQRTNLKFAKADLKNKLLVVSQTRLH